MIHTQRGDRDNGFSLVELLVVILIIGILAAIAIPLLIRQREKAWDVSVESDLRNAAISQDAYMTDGANYATTIQQLFPIGFRPSAETHYFGGVFAMQIGTSPGYYCLTTRSRSGQYLGTSSERGLVRKPTPIDAATCT